MTEKQQLLKELGKISFAAWDIALFLDTHPFNNEALETHRHFVKLATAIKTEYEDKFGPLTSSASDSGHCWEWIEGVWPWERED
ncbi:MAG: spore coat protein CotJB [Clostridiales bacterium]